MFAGLCRAARLAAGAWPCPARPPAENIRQHRIYSSSAFAGHFSPLHRFEKFEVHKVFLQFPNLNLEQNPSLTALRKGSIGFIFQSFNLIDELTVYENIELPLVYLNIKPAERNRRVKEVLEKVNMLHRANHLPQQLSGGQQQRVAIARAVVTNARLLLADEPTGNLDSTNGVEVMELLSTLNKQGTTIIIVTHSQRDAAYAHRIIRLLDGKIIAENRNRPMESDTKIEIL